MPTVRYSNDPNTQNQEGVIYAPNLPWWVDQSQPGVGRSAPPGAEGIAIGAVGGILPEDRSAPPGARPPELGVSAATPSQPTVGGRLSINDFTSGFTPPVYGGGAGAQKTTDDLGFKFTPSRTTGARPTSTTQTTRRVFEGDLPEFKAPERDPRRVAALRQKAAAPGLRKLRTALNRALVKSYENPNVARMVTRSALSGFGEGVEQIMGGASRTAEQQYQSELGLKTQEVMANYQAALSKFMGSATTITETKTGGATKTGDDRWRGQSRPALGIA